MKSMKYPFGILAMVACALFALAAPSRHPPKLAAPASAEDRASSAVPVVVELFTSEGCSSCPPADALLAKLEEQQPIANAQIIALEEHVDYWNNLGWLDPFSASEWTTRQQEYAASLGSRNVYTPQMVIDGQAEFVGSREQQARQAVEEAAARARVDVSLTPRPSGKRDHAEFNVSVRKATIGKAGDAPEVWLAITEAHLHSSVTSGENAGEELRHASVLRTLRKMGIADASKDGSFSGDISVAIDSKWSRQNLLAVAFVQEKRSRQIRGAAEARIEK